MIFEEVPQLPWITGQGGDVGAEAGGKSAERPQQQGSGALQVSSHARQGGNGSRTPTLCCCCGRDLQFLASAAGQGYAVPTARVTTVPTGFPSCDPPAHE